MTLSRMVMLEATAGIMQEFLDPFSQRYPRTRSPTHVWRLGRLA
jgi:hypothetical protein